MNTGSFVCLSAWSRPRY